MTPYGPAGAFTEKHYPQICLMGAVFDNVNLRAGRSYHDDLMPNSCY